MLSIRLAFLLLFRTTFRHWREKLGSYILLLSIVAVGVGAFNGIRQASRSASANFGLFNQAVSGQSDFLIESPTRRLKTDILDKLGDLSTSADWHFVPVIEGSITALDTNGSPDQQLRLVGLDLMGLANLPNLLDAKFDFGKDESNWYDWLGSEGFVWIGQETARKLNVSAGEEINFLASGRTRTMKVRKIIDSQSGSFPDDLLIADLPTVQNLLSRSDELNRVEVIIDQVKLREDKEYLENIRHRIEQQLPENISLKPTQNRAADRAAMTAAFRLNLTILSLIAILVGAYLILQALDAAVVRRRAEVATLISLGVGRQVLFLTFLIESAFIGLIGSVIGIGVGWLFAYLSAQMLADTVNALYFATTIDAISLTWMDCVFGFLLGFSFTLLAGWLPARDAMQTPPAQILSRGDWSPGFSWLRKSWIGWLLLFVGCLSLLISPFSLDGGGKMAVGGFIASACWILGAALLSGHLLVGMAGVFKPFCKRPVTRLASSRLQDGSSRHRLAVAGLVVAVGMVTGMFQMVDSFRSTIEQWFDIRFQAELYVSERGVTGAGTINGIDPLVMDQIVKEDTLAYADVVYISYAKPPEGITILSGVDMKAWSSQIRQLWLKPPGSFKPVQGCEPALISETFARRFGLIDGGSIELETMAGKKKISPVGIFSDYGNEFGTAAVDIPVWKKWTQSERPINVSMYLKDGTDVNAVRDRLRISFPGLDIRNAAELRDVALGIFEQTFKATSALNGIGLVVAFAGLLLGLLAIFDESSRTWLTLRHLGFSRNQFLLSAGLEGAGIGLGAWLSGSIVGIALGWLLIFVINVQSFGWTLQWELPIVDFIIFGSLLVLTGFLSGVIAAAYWNYKQK
jgi:putative ABC transport system permease protein